MVTQLNCHWICNRFPHHNKFHIITPLFKLCECYYIANFFLWIFSIRCICHTRTYTHFLHKVVTYMLTYQIFFIKRKSYDDIIFLVLGTCTRYPFWCCGIPTKVPRKTFCAWWRIFNAFLLMFAVGFRTTHVKNNMRKCDTEGFVPVSSLCGVVGSLSLLIRYLIGRTGKIWSVAYINAKWIYAYETLACTII